MLKNLIKEMGKLDIKKDSDLEIMQLCSKVIHEFCECGLEDPKSHKLYSKYIEKYCFSPLLSLKASSEICEEIKKIICILREGAKNE